MINKYFATSEVKCVLGGVFLCFVLSMIYPWHAAVAATILSCMLSIGRSISKMHRVGDAAGGPGYMTREMWLSGSVLVFIGVLMACRFVDGDGLILIALNIGAYSLGRSVKKQGAVQTKTYMRMM